MKIAATTFGETGGDSLSLSLNLGYAMSTVLFFVILAVCLAAQLGVRRFHPALYWAAIVATTSMGTTLADFIDRGPGSSISTKSGLGYEWGMTVMGAGLILVFLIWRSTGLSFDVQQITTRRAELLYWGAILMSNTLGTALGDYLADGLHLGFWPSGALIAAIMVVIMIAHYTTRISGVLLFWLGFVLTRPLGTTMGNFFSKSHAKGGLDLGNYGTTLALAVLLVVGIGYSYFAINRARVSPAAAVQPDAAPA
ncbi:hypothetical protein [Nocardia sp. alder85J]|uniref:COG4705 family protein n=1 Tax=Nocardia sp. alder85J TaxID=2862949 RepID=UPI0021038F3C